LAGRSLGNKPVLMGSTNKGWDFKSNFYSNFNSDFKSDFKSCSKCRFNEGGFKVLNLFYTTQLHPSLLTNQLAKLLNL
jgi:hypothetical protein